MSNGKTLTSQILNKYILNAPKRGGFFAALTLLGLGLVLSSCTKKQKSDYDLPLDQTFRVHFPTEPPTLDWNKATDTTSSMATTNLMVGLVDYDYDDPELSVVPMLAESWESSPDQKKWVFTMRKGVKWSDGVEFTAQHVYDGWERLLNPDTASEYGYFIYNVKNAKDYSEGKIKDFSKVGLKVNDKGQLEVELERAQSFFPATLNHSSTFPVRKDLIEKYGEQWTESPNLVTLGRYTLKTWDHDRAIVFERNENYWGEKAKTQYILGYIVNEISTALSMFQTGKLDALREVPSLEVPKLKADSRFKPVPNLSIYYLGFNVKTPPFDNKLVRKAISMAIDKREITNLLAGGQEPIKGWLPVGMMGYDDSVGLDFNPEEAKKILAKAGYKEGSELPKMSYGFNTNENHQRIAENVQAQLKRNLGITIELKNEEWKVYLATLRAKAYAIFRMGWVADFADPDNFMGLMLSYSENNRGRWANKEYDALVEKAMTLPDVEERKKLYNKAQKILLEDEAAAIPIYSYVNQYMVADRVQGFPLNRMGKMRFDKVVLK